MKIQNALVLFALTSSVAFAADGPPLNQTVPIDESRYDLNNKEVVETGAGVSHLVSKSMYVRTVYLVKERPDTPKTAYIVREALMTTRPQEVDKYVIVEPKEASKWQYRLPR